MLSTSQRWEHISVKTTRQECGWGQSLLWKDEEEEADMKKPIDEKEKEKRRKQTPWKPSWLTLCVVLYIDGSNDAGGEKVENVLQNTLIYVGRN
jgi:hypothetical protein